MSTEADYEACMMTLRAHIQAGTVPDDYALKQLHNTVLDAVAKSETYAAIETKNVLVTLEKMIALPLKARTENLPESEDIGVG